jgi:hypothetical protein
MRWALLVFVLSLAGVASCRGATLPTLFVQTEERYVVPANVPGWWRFCVEHPSMNWERPGEPKVAGWTTCAGTVDQLRDRVNQLRTAGVR